MIRIGRGKDLDSGNRTMLDTSVLGIGYQFLDDAIGVIAWDGTKWVYPAGVLDVNRTNSELLNENPDGTGEWYLPCDYDAVLYLAINGTEVLSRYEESFTPKRLYGFDNNLTANFKLIVKI